MNAPTDSCFLQSLTVANFFGSDEMRALFGDRAVLQSFLDFEAALARGQASLGLIPVDAARAISDAARIERLDLAEIQAESLKAAHPIVPLVRALVRATGEPAGGFVHLGATTQDVMDTGYVLCARAGLDVVERDCARLLAILRTLSIRHRDTVQAGRTHGQHALPTTFGLRLAGWLDEFSRHADRLAELRARLLVGSFGGAAGTLAGYGPRALELRDAVMAELGLGIPRTSWHSCQDRFAEMVSVLALIASTAEKIAREIYFLGRSEIMEAAEPQGEKQVGSSTMPHKQNPIRSEAITGAAMTLRAQVGVAMGAMVAQDDRDMGPGMALWKLIPESFLLIGGILGHLVFILDDLRLDPDRMRANLDVTGGLIVSEAVMLALAGDIGREAAHHAVSEASKTCRATGRSFADCLKEHAHIAGRIAPERLRDLLDPVAYVGMAREIVDAITGQGGTP
jgi:3-carboxy-cis,cis-muconate cycloisomerase